VTLQKILQRLNTGIPISNPPAAPDGTVVLGEVETLTHEHAHVHDGSSFVAADPVTLGNNTSIRYSITNPAGTEVAHLFIDLTTSSEWYFELFESPTTVTGGAALTSLNRNRNSTKGPLLSVMRGVSAVSDGTRLFGGRVGSGAGGNRVGAQSQAIEEWVLKPGTTYLLHVRCVSAGSADVNIRWYQDELASHEG
jgi:hypothetical protein